MSDKQILIVDDEINIRLTLTQVLENLEFQIESVGSGQDALAKLEDQQLVLMILDLRMPGMDGMEILRRTRRTRPDIKIIMMTAHGTVDSAVEAIKLGAVDFINKPFTPDQIRSLVVKVLDRDTINDQQVFDYATNMELARGCITNLFFEAALEYIKKAIALDPSQAEAFNLMGALKEIQGDDLEANKNYRAALALDPRYKPAAQNLDRAIKDRTRGNLSFGRGRQHNEGARP
jgi:DNA-binding response OmpR family regulator